MIGQFADAGLFTTQMSKEIFSVKLQKLIWESRGILKSQKELDNGKRLEFEFDNSEGTHR